MVAIDNKSSASSELVGLKSKKSADEVDMLFAELFSLVNTSNDEELNVKKSELDFDNNFIKDSKTEKIEVSKLSSRKTENVAKSLAEIFYKELGIDMTKNSNSFDEKKNSKKNLQLNDKSVNVSLLKTKIIPGPKNLPKNISSFNKINNQEINPENFNVSVSVSVSIPEKKLKNIVNKNKLLIQDGVNKTDVIPKQNNKKSDGKNIEVQKNNINPKNIINAPVAESERKKISKKKQINIGEIKSEENIIAKNKNVQINLRENHPIKKVNALKNNDSEINLKIKKNKNDYTTENKVKQGSAYASSETLDMLESSWGEKFSKMIKNAVSSGLNKVEILLKPKNLGKLNVDISVKENSTKIHINAENQESANLLNENLSKINELIDSKNEKLSNSFDSNNNNNFFSDQKKQNKPNQDQIINKKKTIENSTKTSIGEHNIDVQA